MKCIFTVILVVAIALVSILPQAALAGDIPCNYGKKGTIAQSHFDYAVHAILAADRSEFNNYYFVMTRDFSGLQVNTGSTETLPGWTGDNVWTCECIDLGSNKTCEMSSMSNPDMMQGIVSWWQDDLCVIRNFKADPDEWTCENSRTQPSCY